MATDNPIDIKILIFPSILAICAMIALTWFPPKIAQQEAVLDPSEAPAEAPITSPVEMPVIDTIEAPDTIQTLTSVPEAESVNAQNDEQDQRVYSNVEQQAI